MKLAEALLLRADLLRQYESLRDRIYRNALVQEGDRPAEDPKKLLGEAESCLSELGRLILRINEANLRCRLADGTTLTAALAERDILKFRHALLHGTAEAAMPQLNRYSRSEIKYVAVLDVGELQGELTRVAIRLRELNTKIQEANWSFDIE